MSSQTHAVPVHPLHHQVDVSATVKTAQQVRMRACARSLCKHPVAPRHPDVDLVSRARRRCVWAPCRQVDDFLDVVRVCIKLLGKDGLGEDDDDHVTAEVSENGAF